MPCPSQVACSPSSGQCRGWGSTASPPQVFFARLHTVPKVRECRGPEFRSPSIRRGVPAKGSASHAGVRSFFPTTIRGPAKAPCRVDLAGSTLDIWPLYLFHDNVVTLNFAIDRYTSCDIVTRDDSAIVLCSRRSSPGKKHSCRSTSFTRRNAIVFQGYPPGPFLRRTRASPWNRPRKLPPAREFRVLPR